MAACSEESVEKSTMLTFSVCPALALKRSVDVAQPDVTSVALDSVNDVETLIVPWFLHVAGVKAVYTKHRKTMQITFAKAGQKLQLIQMHRR